MCFSVYFTLGIFKGRWWDFFNWSFSESPFPRAQRQGLLHAL